MVTGPWSPKQHRKVAGASPGRANSHPCIFTPACEMEFPKRHRDTSTWFMKKGSALPIALFVQTVRTPSWAGTVVSGQGLDNGRLFL